jgi:hypothetical protein
MKVKQPVENVAPGGNFKRFDTFITKTIAEQSATREN